ncbi:MAG: SRPBCC domain-containing protein [Bryobacterales bacterium]|nr:SRPBCC domain-containing protein [Bryobacterales bacterium]
MTEPRNESWPMKGVIPYLVLEDASAAIECYTRAFGARMVGEVTRDQAGRIMNVALEINGGVMMLMDHTPGSGYPPAASNQGNTLQLVVRDGQAWWDRAVAAGCTVTMPFAKQFWGDFYGRLQDPFGLDWAIDAPSLDAIAKAEAASQPEAPHTLKLERVIAAQRVSVWRCWTDAELLRQWFCPKPWSVSAADFDLKPGGRMNTVMEGPNGERIENQGIWLEIEPMRRLVFTDAFTEGYVPAAEPFITAVVTLDDTEDGHTRMTWSARHSNAEATAKHREMGWEQGWNAAVDQLDAIAQTIEKEGSACHS